MLTLGIIPSHKVALWLMAKIDSLLDRLGLNRHPAMEQIIYLLIIIGIAVAVGLAVRWFVVWGLRKLTALRDGEVGRQLLRQRTFQKCSHFIPPLVFLGMAPFAFDADSVLMHVMDKLVLVYAIIALAYGLGAVATFIFTVFDNQRNTRKLPLKGILNVVLGIIWIVAVIISVAVLVDKSPGTLLAGLGAFAAALMLIFRDSILGFVAGIQMSENDMLHVGDWIQVPGTLANGNVEDVSLSTVKIRNFDNTLIMVPPYDLVSKGFQNYRAMQDTGARRIMINIIVNTDSVVRATPELRASIAKLYPEMKDFLDRADKTNDGWICDNGPYVENGTTETNIGLYRAYATTYLNNNPHLSREQMLMVRQMPPTADGYVIQLYCFANTAKWVAFEAIYSGIMEHLTTALRDFGLVLHSSVNLEVDTPAAK